MNHHSSRATSFVFLSLMTILAANYALGETLQFAVTGDHRSAMDGSGVNDQAVTAIATQISRHGNIQFVLDVGDLQAGENTPFSPPPTPTMADQFNTFKQNMLSGGLIPFGSPGTGIPYYCVRGNHETYDDISRDQVGAWMNAFGQYLPQNGPTTGAKGNSEVGMTYNFTKQNALFLGVDEYINATNESHPIVNNLWVDQEIKARTSAEKQGYVFAFGHTPAYQLNEKTCLAATPQARDDFLNTLFRADGPGGYGGRIYFCGHDHLNAVARIDGPGGKPFYQILVGGGGGPIETFDGVYSKDYPGDAGKATDLYHDSDPTHNIPFHYAYAAVGMNGDSLWVNLYGTTDLNDSSQNWPLFYTLVINGSMTTTAAELGASEMTNDAEVIFDQQVNGTYSGKMGGLGRVLKTGPGTLELTGANTYAGDTTIQQGKLSVNNTSGSGTGTGNVIVESGGTLGGSGTIGGDVRNHGTIAPGNSIGTLTINGNYVHHSDAVYEVELNSAGSSDQIHVTPGSAALQGGSVRVLPSPGNYLNGTRYTILSANGGVTGTFGEIIQPSAILHFSLDTLADRVDLVLQRYTFASQAATRYQASVGGALDQAPTPASGDMQNVLDQLEMMSQEELQLALTQFGPMLYDDMTTTALSGARVFSNTLRNRFGEIHRLNNDYCIARDRIWARGFSNWSSEAGVPIQQPGYRYTLGGGAVGMERGVGDELLTGVSVGYSNAGLAEYENMGSGNLDTLHTALYATWRRETGFYMDASLGWGYDWYENTRPIGLFNRTANSQHTGQEYMVYLDLGIDYPVGNWTIGPQTAIQYVHIAQNGFQEQNASDLGLLMDALGADSLQTRVGLEATRPLSVFNHRLIPRLRLEWLHEYCGAIRTIPAHFSGMPTAAFSAPGRQYKIDGAIVGGGFDACLSRNLTAYLNYDLPLLGDSNTISGYSLWTGIGASF